MQSAPCVGYFQFLEFFCSRTYDCSFSNRALLSDINARESDQLPVVMSFLIFVA